MFSKNRYHILVDIFEDYYEILQVHPLAEPEVVDAAYRKLAQKYHPDINKSDSASEKMQKINRAHDVLGSYLSRKAYDAEWSLHRQSNPHQQSADVKEPVLKVLPKHIRFKNLGNDEIKTSHFDIYSVGGTYTGYDVNTDHLPEWLEITGIEKLGSEPLPARVYIKARGQLSYSKYECLIPINIENTDLNYAEGVKVHIELDVKGPALQVDSRFLEYKVVTDVIPPPQSVKFINLGTGHIEGELIPRQKWIKVSPRHFRFEHQREIQIQIDTSKLVNDMLGYIDVKTNCLNDLITVRASVLARGRGSR
ncbi:MAG: J domain-containing protein [Dehalococcoidia bacterium]